MGSTRELKVKTEPREKPENNWEGESGGGLGEKFVKIMA